MLCGGLLDDSMIQYCWGSDNERHVSAGVAIDIRLQLLAVCMARTQDKPMKITVAYLAAH